MFSGGKGAKLRIPIYVASKYSLKFPLRKTECKMMLHANLGQAYNLIILGPVITVQVYKLSSNNRVLHSLKFINAYGYYVGKYSTVWDSQGWL
jgi:hypothetical protein